MATAFKGCTDTGTRNKIPATIYANPAESNKTLPERSVFKVSAARSGKRIAPSAKAPTMSPNLLRMISALRDVERVGKDRFERVHPFLHRLHAPRKRDDERLP